MSLHVKGCCKMVCLQLFFRRLTGYVVFDNFDCRVVDLCHWTRCLMMLSFQNVDTSSHAALVNTCLTSPTFDVIASTVVVVFRSTLRQSRPNEAVLRCLSMRMYVHPSVRLSVHKKFLRFQFYSACR